MQRAALLQFVYAGSGGRQGGQPPRPVAARFRQARTALSVPQPPLRCLLHSAQGLDVCMPAWQVSAPSYP